jgi:hypothetical protein
MKQKQDSNTEQGHRANTLLYAVAPNPKLSTDAIALDGAVVSRGNGIGATSKPKCYNCKFASSAFKIGNKTHHQCNHLKHKEGFENGTLSPWDTLQEFYNTCTDHEFKK